MSAIVIPFRHREQNQPVASANQRDLDTRPIGTVTADWDKLLSMIGKTVQEPRNG